MTDDLVEWLKREANEAGEHGFRGTADRLDEAAAEIARLRAEVAGLSDPNAVHQSMLRGAIAKPSVAQIRHLYQSALPTWREGVEAALGAVKAEFDAFCDPRYATPISGSTGERFACKQIEAAIRALKEPER